MASVTQKIPNYIQGMSEQPDELKLSGQTTDLLNCVPDVVNQVVKRPGSRFVQNVESEIDAEWFNYYRDEQEQYIGCIRQDGIVRIWDALDGREELVNQTPATQAYLATTALGATSRGLEDLQTITVNDVTFITNRNVFPRMTDDKTPVLENQGYAEVKVLAYARTYKFTIFIPYGTGTDAIEIEITTSTNNTPTTTISVDDVLTGWETQLEAAGFDTTICGNGIYFKPNADWTFYVSEELTNAGNNYSTGAATTTWDDNGTPTPGPNVNIDTVNSGAIETFTLDNTPTIPDGTVLTVIQAGSDDDATITVTVAGTGAATKFNVSTIDTQTMNVFTDNITDFSRLPSQNKTGYRLKVSNTSDAEEDDFWVEFEANDGEKGEGVWNEILQPDSLTTIDATTMPHQIQRVGTGTFEVSTIDYGKRESGVVAYEDVVIDNVTYTVEDPTSTTNPLPSWINQFPPTVTTTRNTKPISKILLFRNRLVFLSNENVSMSQAGAFFSFFADSTIVLSAQDPIDISAASQKPALLYDGVEQNNGLVLFGATQQYLLSSDDSTVGLTQETVKLGTIGYYLYDKDVRPVNMGTTVGFSNMGGRSFRFFEMAEITIDGEPQVTEVSKTVSQLLPNRLTQIADSQEGSQLFFSNADPDRENEVWGFRYYSGGDGRRLQAAWHRWLLPGKVMYHCVMRDTYYAVVRYGTQNRILEFDIKITDESKYYGKYRIHLDNMVDIPAGQSFQGGTVDNNGGNPIIRPGSKTDTVFRIPLSPTIGGSLYVLNPGEAYTTAANLDTSETGVQVNIQANPGSDPEGQIEAAVLAAGSPTPLAPLDVVQTGATGGQVVTPSPWDLPVISDIDLPTVVYKSDIGQFTPVRYREEDGILYGIFKDVTQEYTGKEFVLGYLFDMQVVIPKFYRVQADNTAGTVIKSDTRASLIIHRFTLDAGATGTFDCTLKRLGYADYVETFEANTMDTYKANTPNLADQVTRAIPCYCRNTNLNIVLSSQHPSPFTLYSIAWEGDYTNKFYRSV